MNQARAFLAISFASLLLTGCGATSVKSASTTTGPAAATTLYVNDFNSDYLNRISVYSISQNTTPLTSYPATLPSPIATPTLPANVYAGLMATDGAGNLYIATSADIREYAAGATGLATPIRVIPMTSTTTLAPFVSGTLVAGNIEGIAVDASGNIYASEYGAGIAVFSSTANGNVAPTRYILGDLQPGGGLSTIQQPGPLAVDGAGNLYASNDTPGSGYNLLVFGPTANGNVAPLRTLNVTARALAVDPSGNIYSWPYFVGSNYGSDALAVFPAGASGNATPTRMLILGSEFNLWEISADSVGNLFVSVGGTVGLTALCAPRTIFQFDPTQSGSAVAATAIYSGGGTGCGFSAIAIH